MYEFFGILIMVASLLGMVAVVVAGVGFILPRDHVSIASRKIAASPDLVWTAITDHASAPTWRTSLGSVERLPDRNGREVWLESPKKGSPLVLLILESNPPRELVHRIDDETLPFGGSWSFRISPVAGGSLVMITENGFVSNIFYRFMSRFVLGHKKSLNVYLDDLENKFKR